MPDYIYFTEKNCTQYKSSCGMKWCVFLITMSCFTRNTLCLEKENQQITSQSKQVKNISDEPNNTSSYQKKINYYQDFLKRLNQNKKNKEVLKAHEKLGDLFLKSAQYDKSIYHFLICKNEYEKLKNIEKLVDLEQQLAIVYITIGRADNAKSILENNLLYIERTRNTKSYRAIQFFKVYGVALYYLKDYKNALVYFYKSLEISEITKDNALKIELLNNIGAIHLYYKDFEKADLYFAQSVDIATTLNDKVGVARGKANLAMVSGSRGNYQDAIPKLKFAIAVYKDENDLFSLQTCYKSISDYYEKTKDFDSSLYYHKLFFEIKEQNSNVELQEKVSSLVYSYKIEKLNAENQIKAVKYNSDLKYSKLKNISFGILLVLSILVFYVLFRRAKIKTKLTKSLLKESELNYKNSMLEQKLLKDEIVFKNNELAHTVGHLINKNEILIKLKDAVQQGEDKSKLIQMLNENLNFSNDLKKFEVYLNEMHQTFNFNLKHRFPDLSEKDIRFASLLVLNLSSKEIATILNITPQSVDLKRHRFRKKLNLETTDNLIFILNQFY
jgi:tetratricopeptide (TPR) repeat protein/DNA-binding CsgD family transcriptional regulator